MGKHLCFVDRACPQCDGAGCQHCQGSGIVGSMEMVDRKASKKTAFGEWLRGRRIFWGITLKQASEWSGIGIVRISDIERGIGLEATQKERNALQEMIWGVEV